ncbi:hypothetical protein [Saccharothrix sp.]|uniref:hypothetical protein n=1 Tax=Saccharothrix sp. TaxID=1873460 RepID=UPI002812551D|nr:hypothetical protein [Saccharothrix sp.]
MNSDSGLLAPVRTGAPAADLTADEARWHAAVERIDPAAVALGAREIGSPVAPQVEALTAEVARIDAARPGDLLYLGCADAYVDRARRHTTS